MDRSQYITYMLQTVNEYSKPIQRTLINNLIRKEIVTDKIQVKIGQENDIIDLNQCESGNNKLAYALSQSMRVIKEIEYWEFTKNYKYSIPCELKNFSEITIDKLRENGAIDFELSSEQTDELLDSPGCPTILDTESILFIKFNIKQDTFDQLTGIKEQRKKTIVLYIIKSEMYAEFRFDFISPYDQAKLYDIALYLERIKEYLLRVANLNLIYMELDGLTETASADKNLNIIAQDMQMPDGSKATLQASSSAKGNETYVLPFLGELSNILKEYSEDLEIVPKIKDVLINFISDKKITSNLPWVIIKWENSTDTKFTFNYKNLNFCLVQHYCSYNQSDIGMERMNHVSEYIVRYKKFLTNK